MDRSRILPLAVVLAALVMCLQLSGRAAAETPFLLGDANCDSYVNSIDAMLVLKSAASLPVPELTCPKNGDIDFHPGLTSQDALIILQYHAALLVALPPDALQHISTVACGGPERPSDGDIIANTLLIPLSTEPLLDSHEHDALAREIDGALALIRNQYPEMNDIHARRVHLTDPMVDVSPELMEIIRAIVADGESEVAFITGNADFDLLNARLGLRGVYLFRVSDGLILCLSDYLNAPAAVDAYRAIEGVLDAHPNFPVGDGPSIAAFNVGETWYVLFRDAWGDCPAGCTEGAFYYFAVTDGHVKQQIVPQRGADATFDALLFQIMPWLASAPP